MPIPTKLMSSHPRRPGFTLIELLVVIAIVGLLMAMLVPALGKAREIARQVLCRGQMRQVSVVNEIYLMENNRWMLTYNAYNNMTPVMASHPDANYSAWRELWPDELRYCPNVRNDMDILDPPAGMTWLPRWDYNSRLMWGYNMPMIDASATTYMQAQVYDDPLTGDDDFVRLDEAKLAETPASGGPVDYYGRTWRILGTKPMLIDSIWRTSANTRNMINHAETDSGKSATPRMPVGANMLWLDGSVEWKDWGEGQPLTYYRNIATRRFGVGEGWAGDGSNKYYFWAKPGR